ncbi:MAG: mevalonate kinase [Polyangiales bacterium]
MATGLGKVILLGEHAVVYGHAALAMGLDRGASAEGVLGVGASELRLPSWDRTVRADRSSDEPLARAFAAIVGEGAPVVVTANAAIPAGAGLGCSAALGVAVARAVGEARGETLGDAEAIERAMAWERVFHGNPSGIDATLAALGGVMLFQKGAPAVRVRLRGPLVAVVADTNEPSATKDMVESVRRQREEDPARVAKVFDGIEALVRNGRASLEAGDLGALGKLLDLNQTLLASLLLSTPSVERLVAAARGAGALGAKLTGAGGGGCVVALAGDAASADRIEAALRNESPTVLRAEVTP